jgi:hypothetical protein
MSQVILKPKAIFKFAAYTKKRSFRYSRLCGTAIDAIDTVKLESPQGFIFSKAKLAEFLKIIVNFLISKI